MFLNVKCVCVHQWLFWSTVQKNVHVLHDSFSEFCHKYIINTLDFSFFWKTPKATISLLVLVWMCGRRSWPGFPCTMPWQCVPDWKVPDVRGVLGNKCAGQHNLKTLHFKETIVYVIFGHGHQQFVFFLQRSIYHRTVAASSPVAIMGATPLNALLEGALGQ